MSNRIHFPPPTSDWPIGMNKSESIAPKAESEPGAFFQGCWAFKFGYMRCDNPYPVGDKMNKEWGEGFSLEETDKVFDDASHHERVHP